MSYVIETFEEILGEREAKVCMSVRRVGDFDKIQEFVEFVGLLTASRSAKYDVATPADSELVSM